MADTITGHEIRDQIKAMWPDAYALNTDSKFLVPSEAEVRDLIIDRSAASIKVLDDIAECDDISVILWGRIKEARALQAADNLIAAEDQLSWPLGICFGLSFHGWSGSHWQNICFTKQGILMIEPQLNNFWFASYPDDDVRFALI